MSRTIGDAPELPSDFAVPISFSDGRGCGVIRGLTLGGGGTWFVAWQVGYLHTLAKAGIHLAGADRIIGTSAGSVVAAAARKHRRLRLMYLQAQLTKLGPEFMAKLTDVVLPSRPSTPSQHEAFRTYVDASDAAVDTLIAIGTAARGAQAHSGRTVTRDLSMLIGRRWHSDAVWMTCVDTANGDRCVTTSATGVPVSTAAAASCAVPGIFEPQVIEGRTCMDGGVCGTGVHLDLLAGAERAVVLSLYEDATLEGMLGDREGMMTLQAGDLTRDREKLEMSGTEVFFRAPDHPGMHPEDIMDATRVPEAFQLGVRQAHQDAAELGRFWSRSSG